MHLYMRYTPTAMFPFRAIQLTVNFPLTIHRPVQTLVEGGNHIKVNH